MCARTPFPLADLLARSRPPFVILTLILSLWPPSFRLSHLHTIAPAANALMSIREPPPRRRAGPPVGTFTRAAEALSSRGAGQSHSLQRARWARKATLCFNGGSLIRGTKWPVRLMQRVSFGFFLCSNDFTATLFFFRLLLPFLSNSR